MHIVWSRLERWQILFFLYMIISTIICFCCFGKAFKLELLITVLGTWYTSSKEATMLSLLGGASGLKLHQTLGPFIREKISCGLLRLRLNLICEKRNDWLWSKKSPYFTFFQINILFKFSIALLQNLCGNLDKKFVSDQSSGFERDVPGMHIDEVLFRQNFEFSRAAGHFPATQRASLSRKGLGYN